LFTCNTEKGDGAPKRKLIFFGGYEKFHVNIKFNIAGALHLSPFGVFKLLQILSRLCRFRSKLFLLCEISFVSTKIVLHFIG